MSFVPKPSDHICLVNYALIDALQTSLRLRDISTEVEGKCAVGKWSGIYGQDERPCLHHFDAIASERDKLPLTIQSLFEVPNYGLLRDGHSRDAVMRTGFLHTGKVAVEYRDELNRDALDHLAQSHGSKFAANLQHLTFEKLIIAHPELAGWMLDNDPRIRLVVHPGRISGMHRPKPIHIATMREREARSLRSKARYMENHISIRF